MKKIVKEIDVIACEICGKEIDSAILPVEVIDKRDRLMLDSQYSEEDHYFFHKECVNKLLIDTAKK